MPPETAAPPVSKLALVPAIAAWAMIPLNGFIWLALIRGTGGSRDTLAKAFTTVAVLQFALAGAAVVIAFRQRWTRKTGGIVVALLSALAAVGAPVGWFFGMVLVGLGGSGGGGAWGRPLRIRGRQLHPELKEGADWTRGPRPNGEALAPADRTALGELWLHDAQKEHASVPAFARVSWLLAAAGAPAELLEWAHRAGLEEIEHTRLCFALAAGYQGRSHTVEPMPDLLLGPTIEGHVLDVLAAESVKDGCQLEDFNADVAAECASVCEEPATREVLSQIAREERSHAEFSWAVLGWLLEKHPERIKPVVERSLKQLAQYQRPTAVSAGKQDLVSRADAVVLRKHGRIPDVQWGMLWDQRLEATRERALRLLHGQTALAA